MTGISTFTSRVVREGDVAGASNCSLQICPFESLTSNT